MRTLILATLTAVALMLLSACSDVEGETIAPRPTRVRVEVATSGPALPAIETNGVVATKEEMRLSFKVGGVIKRIHVEEGDTVKRGQRLAELELTEVDAQVDQARALAEKAQRNLERGERLYAERIISLEQLQDLRTQAEVTQAQYESARFNRSHSVITAPRDGVVLAKLAEERELVAAGAPVVVIGASDNGYVVRAALADREVVQLKLGDRAEIRMDAYPGQVFTGTLTQIASAADSRTGLFPIEVRLESPPAVLVNGLVARLTLQPAAANAASLTYVPVGAIVEGHGKQASVFVVDGDRAKRRQVDIAFIAPDRIALAGGLQPGERVVTDGALYLEDDEAIEVVRDAAQTVGNASADTSS